MDKNNENIKNLSKIRELKKKTIHNKYKKAYNLYKDKKKTKKKNLKKLNTFEYSKLEHSLMQSNKIKNTKKIILND